LGLRLSHRCFEQIYTREVFFSHCLVLSPFRGTTISPITLGACGLSIAQAAFSFLVVDAKGLTSLLVPAGAERLKMLNRRSGQRLAFGHGLLDASRQLWFFVLRFFSH